MWKCVNMPKMCWQVLIFWRWKCFSQTIYYVKLFGIYNGKHHYCSLFESLIQSTQLQWVTCSTHLWCIGWYCAVCWKDACLFTFLGDRTCHYVIDLDFCKANRKAVNDPMGPRRKCQFWYNFKGVSTSVSHPQVPLPKILESSETSLFWVTHVTS